MIAYLYLFISCVKCLQSVLTFDLVVFRINSGPPKNDRYYRVCDAVYPPISVDGNGSVLSCEFGREKVKYKSNSPCEQLGFDGSQ